MSTFACGGEPQAHDSGAGIPDNAAFYSKKVMVHPHHPGAALRTALSRCVYAATAAASCRHQELPLLAASSGQEGVSQTALEARLMTSHAWMGNRFVALLPNLPAEVAFLLRSVNAVVIASNIKESGFSPLSGALYLNPHHLWHTASERATITAPAEAAIGEPLALAGLRFDFYRRYLNAGQDISAPLQAASRQDADLILPLVRLLYHHLTIASDYFPPHTYESLDAGSTIAELAEKLVGERISAGLQGSVSAYRNDLGVLRAGQPLTAAGLGNLTALALSQDFQIDSVTDLYAYRSPQHHLAYLSEELLMLYRYNIDREVAIVSSGDGSEAAAHASKPVVWGQRNRIRQTSPSVGADFEKDITYVLQALFPASLITDLRQQVGSQKIARPLVPGQAWEAPLRGTSPTALMARKA